MRLFGTAPPKGQNATVDFSDAYIARGSDGQPYVKDPAALWKEIVELRDDSLTARKQHEKLWALCWLFYKGDQWRKPAVDSTAITTINVGKKPKITINRVLPMVQTRRAHVLKNRPTGIVMPRSTDEEDRNAARVAQDVLNYDQEHLRNWEILDGKLSLCMFVTGNAFKKIYWDPTKGRLKDRNKYRLDPDTGAPVSDPTPVPEGVSAAPDLGGVGAEEVAPASEGSTPAPVLEGVETEPEGDLCVEYVPPEEILPEPSATCMEDCQRLLHWTLKPLKWVKDTFGPSADKVEAVNLKTERGKALASGALMFGLSEREVANRVEVIEAWYRPSPEYPEGLHAVWADDKLMAAGPTPEAHDFIPFVHYVEIETDEFWGLSSVAQVIDPQKALNLAVSRDEFMRQRLRPKLMAATDSGLDENAYTSDESEIVFVQHPFYPKFTEPPLFQRDEKAVEYFAHAIDDIGGSADIMRGQISGGDVRSGRMVNYLQEYAGTVLAGPARNIEKGEEKTGNMILRLRKHYTPEPRLYYIVGRNRSVEVKQFMGSDIEGAADYVVQTGSSLPMSMAEKRDLILSLVQRGVLLPGDPRIIKLMGMPSDVDEMFNEAQIDRDNATEEDHKFLHMKEEEIGAAYRLVEMTLVTQTMAAGVPPEKLQEFGIKPTPKEVLGTLKLEPRDFENHEVHLETHNRARKSKAYKMLKPAAAALYDEHCDLHAMFMLPPPPPIDPLGGSPGQGAGGEEKKTEDGSPEALASGKAPGTGGAGGDVNAQANQERAGGLPPVPSPPGANNHHLQGNR